MSTSVATQANERSVSVASQDTVCTTGLLMGMSSLSWFWLVRAPFHCSDWLSKSRSCFIASFDGESFWFNFKVYLTQRWKFCAYLFTITNFHSKTVERCFFHTLEDGGNENSFQKSRFPMFSKSLLFCSVEERKLYSLENVKDDRIFIHWSDF